MAIEAALTLRFVFHLPVRQAEGCVGSLLRLKGLEVAVPDHTTLSRRARRLDIALRSHPPAGHIERFTGDGAYDRRAIYEAFMKRGATAVVPPSRTAIESGGDSPAGQARDVAVRRIRKVGRRQWRKDSGHHQQARAENTFFRYKRLLGGRLRARAPGGRKVEARLACNILNRMLELGAVRSCAIEA